MIFINDHFIGGYSELRDLDAKKELDVIINVNGSIHDVRSRVFTRDDRDSLFEV